MKKLFILLTVVSLMAIPGFAFAHGSAEKSSATSGSNRASMKLQMWIAGNPVTKPIYVGEANAYAKNHGGVKVDVTDLPGPAYTQKLDTALAAGKPPAIFQLFGPGPQMNTLVKGNKIANLDASLKAHPSFTSRIIPAALVQGQSNGKQYGIPYNIFQEAVVFYNKKDFKKAGISSVPKTWPELMTDVRKIKSAGMIPISVSGTEADNWYGWWLENYEVRLAGDGVGKALKQGNTGVFNTQPVRTAATAMQKLVKEHAFEPGYTTTSEANNVPYALLGTGKAAMLLYGAFVPNFIKQVSPNFIKSGNMGWFSYPSVPGGKDNSVVDLSSTPMLVVNKNMSNSRVKAAEGFLEWFIYSPSQVTALARTGNVGPEAKAVSIVSKVAPADLKPYMLFELRQALHAKTSFVHWGNLIPTSSKSTWNTLKEELFSLKITPQQFASKAAQM